MTDVIVVDKTAFIEALSRRSKPMLDNLGLPGWLSDLFVPACDGWGLILSQAFGVPPWFLEAVKYD